jgi:murein DD-endopeptidase MepM/ murein hydrolase activator NlpD
MCGGHVPVSGGRALVCEHGVVVLCLPCVSFDSEGPRVRAATAGVAASPAWAQTGIRLPVPPWFAPLLLIPLALFLATPGHQELSLLQLDGEEQPTRIAYTRAAAAEQPRMNELSVAFGEDGPVELIWYHPLAGPTRLLPFKADRRFGAFRNHLSRPECGGGHCGVDVGGIAGTIVHAALPGEVTRVVEDPSGRSGKYVRLDHAGGFATYYMHLDQVNPKLVPGVEIAAGEPVGTLGSTGTHNSPPHLHFAVSRRSAEAEQFVDPEPMLRQAILLEHQEEMPHVASAQRPALQQAQRHRGRELDATEADDSAVSAADDDNIEIYEGDVAPSGELDPGLAHSVK